MKKMILKNSKKIALVLIAFCCINISSKLQAAEYTLTVSAPGQVENELKALIGGATNYNLVTSLIVIGNLNRNDINFLQDLGYVTSSGGIGVLEHLDISQTNLPDNTLPYFAFTNVDIDSIILPNSVETLEWQCFMNSNTKYIKIGTSTSVLFEDPTPDYNSLDYTAFSNTRLMTTYEVASNNIHFVSVDGVIYSKDMKNLVAYPNNRPDNNFVVPVTVEKICYTAFSNTINLRTITFPNSLKVISDYAFTKCIDLNSIQWGTGLEVIGFSAFMKAEGLGEVNLPEGLKTIKESAFFWSGLTKVTGSSTLLTLEADCFRGDGISGSTLETVDFSKCTKLNKIGESCFYDCFYLKNVTLPEGLKIVGPSSFQNCYSIEEIVFPNSVEKIQENAFWMYSELYQHKMKKIVLSMNLQNIEAFAFGECTNVTEIHSMKAVPPALINDCFEAELNNKTTIYVQTGSLPAYKAANRWKDFTKYFETGVGIDNLKNLNPDIKIYSSNNKLIIKNANQGNNAYIYTISGSLVKTIKISSNNEEIDLLKGVYLIRINDFTEKVIL